MQPKNLLTDCPANPFIAGLTTLRISRLGPNSGRALRRTTGHVTCRRPAIRKPSARSLERSGRPLPRSVRGAESGDARRTRCAGTLPWRRGSTKRGLFDEPNIGLTASPTHQVFAVPRGSRSARLVRITYRLRRRAAQSIRCVPRAECDPVAPPDSLRTMRCSKGHRGSPRCLGLAGAVGTSGARRAFRIPRSRFASRAFGVAPRSCATMGHSPLLRGNDYDGYFALGCRRPRTPVTDGDPRRLAQAASPRSRESDVEDGSSVPYHDVDRVGRRTRRPCARPRRPRRRGLYPGRERLCLYSAGRLPPEFALLALLR